MSALLSLSQIESFYGASQALFGMSLDIERGAFVMLQRRPSNSVPALILEPMQTNLGNRLAFHPSMPLVSSFGPRATNPERS